MKKLTNFQRQLDILPAKIHDLKVVVIGVGGIGSPLAMTLAKMGVGTLELWDHDTVESHNLPNQLYKLDDFGRSKASALAKTLGEFSEVNVTYFPNRYADSPLSGVVMSAVDTIEARRRIWEGIKNSPEVPFYIEARMAAEFFQVFPVKMADPESVAWYEKRVYKQVKAYEAPCTAAAVFYTVMASSGVIGEVLKKYLVEDSLPKGITFDLNTLRIVLE